MGHETRRLGGSRFPSGNNTTKRYASDATVTAWPSVKPLGPPCRIHQVKNGLQISSLLLIRIKMYLKLLNKPYPRPSQKRTIGSSTGSHHGWAQIGLIIRMRYLRLVFESLYQSFRVLNIPENCPDCDNHQGSYVNELLSKKWTKHLVQLDY